MNRRVFVRSLSVAVVGLGGCTSESSGFSTTGSGSTGETTTSTRTASQAVKVLRGEFEERGLSVEDLSVEEGTIEVTVQTTGDVDEDVRTAAGAYATRVSILQRDLRVHVEDRGIREATFEIEREWAEKFADGRLSDGEYIERVNGTRKDQ